MTATPVPEVVALPDAAAVARRGAALVAELLTAAGAAAAVSVVLAGGATPRRLYEVLAREHGGGIPWHRVHLLFGDERCVPPDDPASNYGMARASLTARVPIPAAHVHRVPTELPPARAAAAYEAVLRARIGGGELDLVMLGVGRDGHTASLFPGHPAVDEQERWAVAVEHAAAAPPWRVTLTLPVLNRARVVLFVVTGADKAAPVAAILGDPARAARYPAGRVRGRERTIWLADRAALGGGS